MSLIQNIMVGKKKDFIRKDNMIAIKNAISGEMETAKVTMIVQRDTPKFKGEPFTMLFQAVTKAIAREIQPATAKLLLYLCAEVGYGNVVQKGIPQMAIDLSYSERQIHRAMNDLIEKRVIIKTPNPSDKRLTMYSINALQSWKGTVSDRKKHLATCNPNQLDMFLGEKALIGIEPNENF